MKTGPFTHADVARTVASLALALAVVACDRPPTGAEEAAAGLHVNHAVPTRDFDLTFGDVRFRPDALADIHVQVFVNETLPCRDPLRTAFFIHGVNATAASWEGFAEAFFEGPRHRQLCVVAAVDHPGHGESGLPRGVPFGELIIEDYARSVIEVLTRLSRRGIRPTIIVGHSQGTSTTQTVQQMLIDQGSSLGERFGIRDAVFLGAQGPEQLPMEFLLPDEAVADLISSLLTTTPEKGTFILGPPSIFQQLWFINLDLELSSDAPSVEEIATNGWNEDVPLFAALQAATLEGFAPPPVDAGVFGAPHRTRLHVVDFADDPWSLTPRAEAVYEYLTGDASLARFVTLTDPDNEAVHDYMITDAARVRSVIPLPR